MHTHVLSQGFPAVRVIIGLLIVLGVRFQAFLARPDVLGTGMGVATSKIHIMKKKKYIYVIFPFYL